MKKKIIALCLIVALAATAVVGGTLAYFSDTKAQTNAFAAGQLTINLDEVVVSAEPNENGDLVGTGERTSEKQEYKLFPGMTVDKDPTITLNDLSENAYIAAIVTISADEVDGLTLDKLAGYGDNTATLGALNIHELASGGLVANNEGEFVEWNGLTCFATSDCYIYQEFAQGENEWTLYVFMKDAFKAGDKAVLFEQLNISEEFGNEEMKVLDSLEIKVEAFGAQEVGFTDCYDAMTNAFAERFNFAS